MYACFLPCLSGIFWGRCFLVDDMAAEEQLCIMCEKPVIDDWFNLSKRGLETIHKFCSLHDDKRVEEYLMENGLDVVMHNKYRKDYTNEKRLSKRSCGGNNDGVETPQLLRSTFD